MPWQKAAFLLLIIISLTPYGSPPIALALGLFVAFVIGNPFPMLSGRPTELLLQASVVLLGFGLDLSSIFQAGKKGVFFAAVTIFATLGVGYLLGKLFGVPSRTSTLISSGTAICGGSAIAAVAPAIGAEKDEISVSLGTVFVLNAIALFVFPVVGHAVGLTQNQFGVWAAIAIHDTSSVVGAAGTYGAEALAVATTVKLARAIWIVPVVMLFSFFYRKHLNGKVARRGIPWFIVLFLITTTFRTYAPPSIFPSVFDSIVNLAKAGMVITLFLIGASLSPQMIRNVGAKPLVQGILLWFIVSAVGLWAVLRFL